MPGACDVRTPFIETASLYIDQYMIRGAKIENALREEQESPYDQCAVFTKAVEQNLHSPLLLPISNIEFRFTYSSHGLSDRTVYDSLDIGAHIECKCKVYA